MEGVLEARIRIFQDSIRPSSVVLEDSGSALSVVIKRCCEAFLIVRQDAGELGLKIGLVGLVLRVAILRICPDGVDLAQEQADNHHDEEELLERRRLQEY